MPSLHSRYPKSSTVRTMLIRYENTSTVGWIGIVHGAIDSPM
jgi:hypothetical protein